MPGSPAEMAGVMTRWGSSTMLCRWRRRRDSEFVFALISRQIEAESVGLYLVQSVLLNYVTRCADQLLL